MPRLPDVSPNMDFGNRPIPRSQRQVVQVDAGMEARAMRELGEEVRKSGVAVDAVVEKRQEEEDQLDMAYAESALLRGQLDTINGLDDPDYGTYETRYGESMKKVRAEAAARIKNPKQRALFEARSEASLVRGLEQVRQKAKQKEIDHGNASLMQAADSNNESFQVAPDEATRAQIIRNTNMLIDESVRRGYMDETDGYEAKKKWADNAIKLKLSQQHPEEILSELQTGGFDTAMAVVAQNEGGFTASDGASGAPAIFGINRKWHPEAFDEVKRITESQGEAAGKAAAKAFYKREYWDKFNISSLPPETQAIVFDGVVNHRHDQTKDEKERGLPGFAKQLVEAARSGETPEALIEMRKNEYRRLAQSEKYAPSFNGWMNRLDKLQSGKTGRLVDFLSPESRLALAEQAKKDLIAAEKLKREDPAQWALERNLGVDETVAMQPNPLTASVLPKDSAKALAQQIKDVQSPDTIISIAQEMNKTYGQYKGNAVRDLVQAGMPAEFEAAMALALDNPVTNREHIGVLFDVAKAGDKGLNDAYKNLAFDPKVIDEKVMDVGGDFLEVMSREGYGLEDINRNASITAAMAKAYRIKNPSASEKEAVEFAMQPMTGKFTFGEVNGVKFRIPAVDAKGNALDADEVESRLEQHLEGMEFKASGPTEAIAAQTGKRLKDLAIPFLNAAGNGIRFHAPDGTLLLDKDGNVAEMTFDEIISKPTPEEIRQERINASFDKREPRF